MKIELNQYPCFYAFDTFTGLDLILNPDITIEGTILIFGLSTYVPNLRTILASLYLIFVAGRRARPVEEKSVMWRNFKILYMKHVEKAKICPHVD